MNNQKFNRLEDISKQKNTDNQIDLEGIEMEEKDMSFEEEVENLKQNYSCIDSEIVKVRNSLPYPDIHPYDTASDYDEISDLQYKKKTNIPYWDEIDELTPYADCGSLYSGHLSYGDGRDYYVMDSPSLKTRTLKNGAHLINADDREYNIFVKAWRFPDTDDQAVYSSNLEIVNRELMSVDVKLDKSSELYSDISDSYLRNALIRNKEKIGIQSIIQTIQKKQNDIRSLDLSRSFVVQGCAGSGKTMVLLHRLRYLFYNRDIMANQFALLVPTEPLKKSIKSVSQKFNIKENRLMSFSEYYQYLLGRTQDIAKEANELVFSQEYLSYVYSEDFIRECFDDLIRNIATCSAELIEDCDEILNSLVEYESKLSEENMQRFESECISRVEKTCTPFLVSKGIKLGNIQDVQLLIDLMNEISAKAKENKTDIDVEINSIEILPDDPRIINDSKLSFLKSEIANEENAIEKASFITAGAHKKKLKQIQEQYQAAYNALVEVCKKQDIEKLKEQASLESEIVKGVSIRDFEHMILKTEELYVVSKNEIEKEKTKQADFETYLNEKYKSEIEAITKLISASEGFYSECEEYIQYLKPAIKIECENWATDRAVSVNIILNYIELASNALTTMSKYAVKSSREELLKKHITFTNRTEAQQLAYVSNRLFNIFRRKIKEKYGKTLNVIYKHYWYLNLYANYLIRGANNSRCIEYVFIDEAQDLSLAEMNLIKKYNTISDMQGEFGFITEPVFNLFGDVNQVISKHGISDWSNIPYIKDKYILNENFRNTNQIIDFCNENLRIEMTKVGIDLEDVNTYSSLSEAMTMINFNDKTIIVKDEYACEDIRIIMKEANIQEYDVFTIKGSKGLEFREIVVIDRDMTDNEKYIAYTRALKKLHVINDMEHRVSTDDDLAIDGENTDE